MRAVKRMMRHPKFLMGKLDIVVSTKTGRYCYYTIEYF